MTALKGRPGPEPEVLIEEARRGTPAAVVFVALIAVAGAFWITSGGGPPSGTRPAERGDEPGVPSAAAWREVGRITLFSDPGCWSPSEPKPPPAAEARDAVA